MNFELDLPPEEAFNPATFQASVLARLNVTNDGYTHVRVLRRSIDARQRKVVVKFVVDVAPVSETQEPLSDIDYKDVSRSKRVIIVGAGPAGLFAALRLIELGIKPVVIERGKDVQARRRDLAAINKDQGVNPESNYCFGEGGAGTYSDGKLYTRSKKRGDVRRILEIMVAHGASDEILYDAHPHIGTNQLPKLVVALRESIIRHGGEVHFNMKVAGLAISGGSVTGIRTDKGDIVDGEAVILATGHSARDVFQWLHESDIRIEAKPFAVGVRVEHQQDFIDRIQYHCAVDRGPFLPASSYALVHQAEIARNRRGVFSFCMCPGGFIVPAATADGEVVVNGMSPSRRDSKFANSGIVVEVKEEDFGSYARFGPMAGVRFQEAIERKACAEAGGTQKAPAQLLQDFVDRKVSASLLASSYQPGLSSVELHSVLPGFIAESLVQGFRNFGQQMKGYLSNEAQILGVESRTSSPVKIPRTKETGEHVHLKRLFPSGEGGGYAGGIVSAAMDGERSAESVFKKYLSNG